METLINVIIHISWKIILLYFLQKATEVRKGWHFRDECGDKARPGNLYLSMCTGKCFLCSHMQALLEAQSVSMHIAGSWHPLELILLHQRAKPQHSMAAHWWFLISSTPPAEPLLTARSPSPGAWQGLGGRRKPQVKHRCNLLHKNLGEESRTRISGTCLQQS